MTETMRITCLVLGVLTLLWSTWSARPRPYNIVGGLGPVGLAAMVVGLLLIAAAILGWPA